MKLTPSLFVRLPSSPSASLRVSSGRFGSSFSSVRSWLASGVVLVSGLAVACVPSGNSGQVDAGPSNKKAPSPTFRPSTNVITAVFEDNFDRTPKPVATTSTPPVVSATTPPAPPVAMPEAGATDSGAKATARDAAIATTTPAVSASSSVAATASSAPPLPPAPTVAAPVEQAPDLGPDWYQADTKAWRIENGKLCGANARNHPVWLKKVLPINARIEFDAVSESPDGDLKAEFWGDGKSFANPRVASYSNATSYLTIFGGWKNKLHALARIDEHGNDRKLVQIDPTSDDPKQRPVNAGQVYRFKIERVDGRTVKWFVDGLEYLDYPDAHPLVGDGHDHFGFNDWEAKVCFDNVKVTPL